MLKHMKIGGNKMNKTKYNKYYKVSDGFFDYYININTGEKKFTLENDDIEVEKDVDDFIRKVNL